MDRSNDTEKILALKANKTNPEWEPFVKECIKYYRDKRDFVYCAPMDQIQTIFNEFQGNKDDDIQKMKKMSDAYYCLHRYAINLCGSFNTHIAKLIKVNSTY